MKTATKAGAKAPNGKGTPEQKEGVKSTANNPQDTQKGSQTADVILKAEPKDENRIAETKSIGDIIEAIRQKNKLVNDLNNTIERQNLLQQLYSDKKLKITVEPIEYNSRTEVEFTNETIVDYIVSMLIVKSKEVVLDIENQLKQLEK